VAERADIPLKSNLQLLALEEAIPAGGQGKPARNWGRVVRWLRLTACGAVIFCSYLWGTGLRAQVQVRSEEYRLKLVFLYNFAKFVEWPADAFPAPQAPLKLCVVGQIRSTTNCSSNLRNAASMAIPMLPKPCGPAMTLAVAISSSCRRQTIVPYRQSLSERAAPRPLLWGSRRDLHAAGARLTSCSKARDYGLK
jgi:uncharacterized protein DUF4154